MTSWKTVIDCWIMDKFSILPTDNRFLNLYEEQKAALFEGVCSLPDNKDIKRHKLISEKIEEIKNKKNDQLLSPGLIRNTEITLKKEGYTESQINDKIKQMVERKRNMDIKEAEGFRNG